jgi:hypothetical protein
MFTHPPRKAKTSGTFQYAELAGTKHNLFVTVKNGIDVYLREFERMGIPGGVRAIKSLDDLDGPETYKLASFQWLKSTGHKKLKDEGRRLSREYGAACPFCDKLMVGLSRTRAADAEEKAASATEAEDMVYETRSHLSTTHGHRCNNIECPGPAKKRGQLGVFEGGLYNDLDLKRHLRSCVEQGKDHWRGRECMNCGYVYRAWVPPRYKRIGKRFSLIAVDEIHNIKSGSTDQARAILGMTHAKRRIASTGTLIPNMPQDAFYPCSWTFGQKNHEFGFSRGTRGVAEFNRQYTEKVIVESESGSYTRAVPFIKTPMAFWGWKSSKTLFRLDGDPMVDEALAKAGFRKPEYTIKPRDIVPAPDQAMMLVSSLVQFEKQFKEYSEELKNKTAKSHEGKQYLINSTQVLASMTTMRFVATVPGYINDKVVKAGLAPVYTGAYGGCKIEAVAEIVEQRTKHNGKVLIFSDMRAMQRLLAEELAYYHPILFDTSWDDEERAAAFERFQTDDKYRIFIGGPRSVKESIDLSRADTVISTDLLWSPGTQMQAWNRALTPRPEERHVEIHVLLTKYSIDRKIHQTFYSKLAAAQQALYGHQVTKADKGFDVTYFVDQVLSDKKEILEWLVESGEDEMAFMPVFHRLEALRTLSDEE